MINDQLTPRIRTHTGPGPAADVRRTKDALTARLRHELAMPVAGRPEPVRYLK